MRFNSLTKQVKRTVFTYQHYVSKSRNVEYDAIIVGGGLSGLATGIRLQQAGKRTLLIEKNSRVGGLCKSIKLNNTSFEIGCNDFGRSIESQMTELGVQHDFKKVKTQFIFGNQRLLSPFDRKALFTFLRYPRNLTHLLYLMIHANEQAQLSTVTHQLQNLKFRNIIHTLLAYLSFRPVENIDLAFAKRLLKSPYGYDDPRVPIGGTQSLIDAIRTRYELLGGTLQLDTKFISASHRSSSEEIKYVEILETESNKQYTVPTQILISSTHGWEQYPPTAKTSLSVAALLVCVDKRFQLPNDIHTFIFSPPNIEQFLSDHDQGILSNEIGFHWFQHHPIKKSDNIYALTAYFLWPREAIHTNSVEKRSIEYILKTTEEYFPGFKEAISGEITFISPNQYTEQYGINSCLAHRVLSGVNTLPCYSHNQDMYFIGNAMNNPEDQHAGGALDSAKKTVEQIMRQEFHTLDSNTRQQKKLDEKVKAQHTWKNRAAMTILGVFGVYGALKLLSYLNVNNNTFSFPFWDGRTQNLDNMAAVQSNHTYQDQHGNR